MPGEGTRDLFEARLEDAIRKSNSGSVAHIPFLTMRESRRAERILDARGMHGAYWFWGGHKTAERTCLFLLPEYLVAILPEEDAETALKILEEHKESFGNGDIIVNKDVAKISIVGAGMANNSGVACKMFEALFSAGININMISTSEIKVSVLVNKNNADAAVRAIHAKFNLA